MKILVVDDKEEERYLAETLLKGSGYEVETAANGAEALEKLRAKSFDMIVSDVLMPVMDGFRLCRECQGDEKLKDIPFIFHTATYKDERDEVLASKVGAERFIRKPIEPEEFVKIIQGVSRDVEEGKIGPKRRVLEEEKEVLKLYSGRLIAKLEKKMLDMEREITERKQAEEALRTAEHNFRNSLDSSPLGTRIVTAKGELLYANQAILDIYGYSSVEELKAMPAKKRYTPQSYAEHQERKERRKLGKPAPSNYEISIVRKDGEVRHLEVLRKEVLWDGETQFQVIYQDVTKRKQVEEALKGSEEKYRAIFNEARDGIVLVDSKTGNIADCNPEFERQTGRKLEQLKEMKIWEVRSPKKVKAAQEKFAEIRGKGVGGSAELEFQKPDGEIVPIEFLAKRIKIRDKDYIQTLTRDITERKQAEAKAREVETLKEVDRLRSGLLANVSHELRTPLTSIKGFASTLLRTDVKWSEEEQRDFLQTIDQESDRLIRIISDLLDMSRLEAGGLKLEKRNYQVSEILDSISSGLTTLTKRHQLQVIVSSDLPSVFVDQMRIGQVLTNLVENATKFSPEDSEITIEAQLAGDQTIVSVTDRGQGIAPELLPLVFDRFYQAESIVTGRKSGTGLGLSICKGIIESHSGKIWVESKVGEGSKVSFSLPVSKREEEVA